MGNKKSISAQLAPAMFILWLVCIPDKYVEIAKLYLYMPNKLLIDCVMPVCRCTFFRVFWGCETLPVWWWFHMWYICIKWGLLHIHNTERCVVMWRWCCDELLKYRVVPWLLLCAYRQGKNIVWFSLFMYVIYNVSGLK